MIYTALDTFYLSANQLQNSPSRKDGVDEENETKLRIYGAELIQEAGILLKLPQVVMATGQVLLHRFYCKQSLARYNVKRVAASCVFLATKLEECPRRARDVLVVFHRMNQRREGLPLEPLEHFSMDYNELKTELVRTERHLLKEMGFICHVEHPHKFIPNYLEVLDVQDPSVRQRAWSLANDSLRTPLCVRFKSEVVACGVIYVATRQARIPLPENPAWWLIFDATKHEIDDICRVLADLYKSPKAAYVEVGKERRSSAAASRTWEAPGDPKEAAGAVDGEAAIGGKDVVAMDDALTNKAKAIEPAAGEEGGAGAEFGSKVTAMAAEGPKGNGLEELSRMSEAAGKPERDIEQREGNGAEEAPRPISDSSEGLTPPNGMKSSTDALKEKNQGSVVSPLARNPESGAPERVKRRRAEEGGPGRGDEEEEDEEGREVYNDEGQKRGEGPGRQYEGGRREGPKGRRDEEEVEGEEGMEEEGMVEGENGYIEGAAGYRGEERARRGPMGKDGMVETEFPGNVDRPRKLLRRKRGRKEGKEDAEEKEEDEEDGEDLEDGARALSRSYRKRTREEQEEEEDLRGQVKGDRGWYKRHGRVEGEVEESRGKEGLRGTGRVGIKERLGPRLGPRPRGAARSGEDEFEAGVERRRASAYDRRDVSVREKGRVREAGSGGNGHEKHEEREYGRSRDRPMDLSGKPPPAPSRDARSDHWERDGPSKRPYDPRSDSRSYQPKGSDRDRGSRSEPPRGDKDYGPSRHPTAYSRGR